MQKTVLAHPPIREAIFEVIVKFPAGKSAEEIDGFYELIKDEFPNKQKLIQFQGKFQVKTQAAGSIQPEPKIQNTDFGITCTNEKNTNLIQARINGFAFAKINKSYSDWDEFKTLAVKYLKMYLDYTSPSSNSRISLRYVNSFDIPFPIKDLSEYLTTAPSIDNELNAELKIGTSGYYMQLQLFSEKYNARSIINQTMTSSLEPNNINIVFDIDVIREFNDEIIIQDDIVKQFDTLRDYKNDIFFKSITETTKKLFN